MTLSKILACNDPLFPTVTRLIIVAPLLECLLHAVPGTLEAALSYTALERSSQMRQLGFER